MGFPLTFVVTFERFHRALLSLATLGDVKPRMMPGAKRRRVSSSAETCQDLLPDPQFNSRASTQCRPMPVCPAERSGQPGEKRQGRDRVDRRKERSEILADFN